MTTLLKEYEKMEDRYEIPPSNQEALMMLINGVTDKIESALDADARGELTEKGFYLGRATGIIDALRNMLNPATDDQTAKDLDVIYNHVDLCLQAATSPENNAYLHEAMEIMENLAIGCNMLPPEAQQAPAESVMKHA